MSVSDDEFWDSNNCNHPPLTDEMIAIAEERLGVRLPEEYLSLLRIHNGGYTKGFGYPMTQPTTWAENHVPLPELFGIVIDPNLNSFQNILSSVEMTSEWGSPPKQVLLAGDGHWWITLDYRDNENPSVAWIDTECDEDVRVADSFSAFIAGLRPDEEFDLDEA